MSDAARDDHGAYITRCPECKGIDAACVDDGTEARRHTVASFLYEKARSGCVIERTSVSASQSGTWCECPFAQTELFQQVGTKRQ